jgi:ribosomal protein S18 acetylase RimI-like enzyme
MSHNTISIMISHPPSVTISSSPEYANRLIEHNARSFFASPIMNAFVAEVDGLKHPPFNPLTYERKITHFESGSIRPSARDGALIAEADDWTAAALWEAPGFKSGMDAPRLQDPLPLLKEFMDKAAAVKARHMGPEDQQRYWHLSFLARDPSKKGRGAVSAVMRPFLEKAEEEGVPAWLEAVDLHAVEVYEHYGFRVCEVITVGKGEYRPDGWPEEGGEGFNVWAMIYDSHLKG